jgi:hypothetical protein
MFFSKLVIAWQYMVHTSAIKKGFTCQDPSISLPYKQSTIEESWLHLAGILVPLTIWFLELFSKK